MRPRWPDPVTRIRAALITDDYGTPSAERDWATAVSTTIHGCSVQPVPGAEYELGREAVVSRWRLFAPTGTELLATDRVAWSGATYEIDGDVQAWSNHTEAFLKRVTG